MFAYTLLHDLMRLLWNAWIKIFVKYVEKSQKRGIWLFLRRQALAKQAKSAMTPWEQLAKTFKRNAAVIIVYSIIIHGQKRAHAPFRKVRIMSKGSG